MFPRNCSKDYIFLKVLNIASMNNKESNDRALESSCFQKKINSFVEASVDVQSRRLTSQHPGHVNLS